MKSRVLALILVGVTVTALAVGCSKPAPAPTPAPTKTQTQTQKPTETAKPDATTSATAVDNAEAFVKNADKDGKWLFAATKDLTLDKDLVIEGDLKNEEGKVARKMAMYTQKLNADGTNVKDANGKNVTDQRFTLTVPRVIVKSENTNFKEGVVKGDVYVQAKGFTLTTIKIDGNLYFATQELKDAFKLADGVTVTGKTEVKALEAATK